MSPDVVEIQRTRIIYRCYDAEAYTRHARDLVQNGDLDEAMLNVESAEAAIAGVKIRLSNFIKNAIAERER